MIYLDDRFPDHPKVVKAGDEAGWMYVAGLGYSNRNGTLGRIPKAMVGRLTNHRRPGVLAARLVEANLWEDEGDCYVIHDYEPHNKSAIARSEHAKKAAEARWNRSPNGSSPDARASDEHMPEQTVSNAGAMLPSRARARPHAHQAPRDQETSSSSVSEELPSPPQPEEEEDSEVESEVQRRLASSLAAGTRIANVEAWKAKTRAGIVAEIRAGGRVVLEPPRAKPPDPTEATAAAHRQRAERNEARARGEACGTCEGYGRVLDDDVAYPCRACGPQRLSVVGG